MVSTGVVSSGFVVSGGRVVSGGFVTGAFVVTGLVSLGFLVSGGEYDLERMAAVLLDEYRSGKLGRITLEIPEENV